LPAIERIPSKNPPVSQKPKPLEKSKDLEKKGKKETVVRQMGGGGIRH